MRLANCRIVGLAVLAVVLAGRAQADRTGAQIQSDVTDRACSAALADEWQDLRTDGKFVARGDARGRVPIYASPADAAGGVNSEKAYLVDGDFVEQPEADTDDWTNLSAAAAQSMPDSDAVTGKPDLRLDAEQDADPGRAGIADCIRYQRDERKPVFGWVRPANLGALPGMRWPAHLGGDGRDEEDKGIITTGFRFCWNVSARDAAAALGQPYEFYELVDDKVRCANDDVDDSDCGFSVYLLNNAVFVPYEDGFDCWGNHGQDDPAEVYLR